MSLCMNEVYLVLYRELSNDPGKKGSNFFCYCTIGFPLIEMILFVHRECVNLQRQSTK